MIAALMRCDSVAEGSRHAWHRGLFTSKKGLSFSTQVLQGGSIRVDGDGTGGKVGDALLLLLLLPTISP